jgi:hypothetical protein
MANISLLRSHIEQIKLVCSDTATVVAEAAASSSNPKFSQRISQLTELLSSIEQESDLAILSIAE